MPLTMVLSETTNGQTIHYWHGLDTLAQSDGTSVSYFEYDGLGSVRQVVDGAGEVGLSQTFDPYGNPYANAGSAATSLGFTGEFGDSNGFVFLRARYYNPSVGRFLNTDPSRQERNPYQYSMGNPVNYTDPSGQQTCPGGGAVCQAMAPVTKPYVKGSSVCTSGGFCWTSEYLEFDPPEDFAPVHQSGGQIPASQFGYGSDNFCGVFSVAAIVQNLGSSLGIDEIIALYTEDVEHGGIETADTNDASGSSFEELHRLVERIAGFTTEPAKSETNDTYRDDYPDSEYTVDEYYNVVIRDKLSGGRKPIILVGYQETAVNPVTAPTGYRLTAYVDGGLGHFITITGLSDSGYWGRGDDFKWVRVYNSFRNGTEYYRADTLSGYQPDSRLTMYVCREGPEEGKCLEP